MVSKVRRFLILVCFVELPFVPLASGQDCRASDIVFHNAKIVTMDDSERVQDSLAVGDAKITFAGNWSDAKKCVSAQTAVVDLGGKTVLPGLIDVHTHALEWAKGALRNQVDATYPGTQSIAALTQEISKRSTASKDDSWITGAGWDDGKYSDHRYVTRADLDPVSAAHPVYLVHVSGHLAVANSAALKLAGITKATPDPSGGVIEHDAKGEPTGILKDNAMELVARFLPADPPDLPARAAKLVSESALRLGLTTIHDINLAPADLRGYQQAANSHWLELRVQMVPRVRSLADAQELASSGLSTGFGNDHLRLGAAKIFADGGMGARTIAIYPPPLPGEPENLGLLIWNPQDLQKAHHILAAARWQLVTHAIGDRAMDEVLDSYAATQKDLGLKDPRFRIAHGGLSTPPIQKRLKELNVIVDGNPAFVYWIGSWFKKYGEDRVRWSYPAKSYIENGITEAAGTDVPVTPMSPWWGIWSAVTRKELTTGAVLAPEERLTILQALRLYTRNGAYDGFEERTKGSLEIGKFADFIVVDRDVLSVPSDELKDVKVLSTYVGGKLVSSVAKTDSSNTKSSQ
jgi:predicted amidohydrolase YtcJ